LVVNREDELIGGHGRDKAAQLLGLGEVVAGVSAAKRRVLAIARKLITIQQRSKRNEPLEKV
jgi:ParB-like chromosome segregation protein Spo0J